jgi:drug/metabolite transporter (DMT)-like permease
MANTRNGYLIFLHITLLIYSFAGIFSKLASTKQFLSFEYIFYYCLVLIILFVYAILWQQVLKKLPLNTAFANKSAVIIWGIIWGKLIFSEKITLFMLIGAVIILIGITLVVTDNEK